MNNTKEKSKRKSARKRFKILYIAPVLITEMFKSGKHYGYYLYDGLPDNAEIVGAAVTNEAGIQQLKLVIESSSFSEVQDGEPIPEYEKPFTAHQLKTDDVDYYGRKPEELSKKN